MTTTEPDDAGQVAATPKPDKLLGYSGMTNTSENEGTAATDNDLPGDAPTGKETARVEDVVADGEEPLITRLQPGTGS